MSTFSTFKSHLSNLDGKLAPFSALKPNGGSFNSRIALAKQTLSVLSGNCMQPFVSSLIQSRSIYPVAKEIVLRKENSTISHVLDQMAAIWNDKQNHVLTREAITRVLCRSGMQFSEIRGSGVRLSRKKFNSVQRTEHLEPLRLQKTYRTGSQHLAKQQIPDFLEQHSCPVANETRIVADEEVPARALDAPIRALHRQFCKDHASTISFSSFRKVLPKNFIKPHRKTDYCDICFHMSHDIKKLQALYQKHLNYATAYRLPIAPSSTALQTPDNTSSSWSNPAPTPTAPADGLTEAEKTEYLTLEDRIKAARTHQRHKDTQRTLYQRHQVDLIDGQGTLVIDFKENVRLGSSVQLGREFYEAPMRSVFGCVLWYKQPNQPVKKVIFDIVSEYLNHDMVAAVDCLDILFQLHEFQKLGIRKLRLWTDCGGSFRCYSFAHYVMVETLQKHVFDEIEWHLFVEKHGKSEVDAHFSNLSTWLETKKLYGDGINNTEQLIHAWSEQSASSPCPVHFKEYIYKHDSRTYPAISTISNIKDYYFFKVCIVFMFGVTNFHIW